MPIQRISSKSDKSLKLTNQNISQSFTATIPQQPDKIELSNKKKNIIKYSTIGVGVLAIIIAGIKLPKLFKKIMNERKIEVFTKEDGVIKEKNIISTNKNGTLFHPFKITSSKLIDESFESFMQKRFNINEDPNSVKHNSKFLPLTMHNYDTIPECYIETATSRYDFMPFKLSNNKIETITRGPVSMINNATDGNVGKWEVGVTKDNKKYLHYILPDGRKDEFGRNIRQITTLISPNSNFTEAQKDLISALSSYSANDLNKMYDTPLSQYIIDSTYKNSGNILDNLDMNLDALLSGIKHWKNQIKQLATDILEKIEKLNPGEYISSKK